MQIFSEIITLEEKKIFSFCFIELPNGDKLLTYLSNEDKILKFKLKSIKSDSWEDALNQNSSNLTSIIKKKGKLAYFNQFYDNKGDLIHLLNIINKDELMDLFITESFNYGKDWNELKKISHEHESWKINSYPTILKNGINAGNIMVPLDNIAINRSFILTSNDNCNTWSISLPIEPEEELDIGINENLSFTNNKSYCPFLVERNDGFLQTYFKSNNHKGIHFALSKDLGATWNEPKPINNLIEANGHYSVLKILSKKKETNKLIILGTNYQNKLFIPTLWISDDSLSNFTEFWKSPKKYHHPLKFSYLYQDSENYLHILLNFDDNQVFHYQLK